jgi:bifunctional enzyme CysN/CysC
MVSGAQTHAGTANQSVRPCCLWFTGLSGAGKSLIAGLVDERLRASGGHTFALDGDVIRQGLNSDLGFSIEDRAESVRRVGHVAKLFRDAGMVAIVSFISPIRADRQQARQLFAAGDFIEIFVDTPIAECERRDPKGLYAKARAGKLPNFTGITSPYEAPGAPEVHLIGTGAPGDLVEQVLGVLRARGFLQADAN